MKFNSLKEKCNYYRSLTDYKLLPNSYVIAMIDGRSFSKMIKNRFKKPFDNEFIDMMNETAVYVAKNIQGCKFAYTQSDEISFVIYDDDTADSDSFFGYRICKLQSIIASLATAKFNQLMTLHLLDTPCSQDDMKQIVSDMGLCQFDCKVWNVPSFNDMFAWLLYRQIDCIRNSKQQAAQTYLSHKQLIGLHTDEQIKLLKDFRGIDWNTEYNDGEKYGRFIYKEKETYHNDKMDCDYTRDTFKSHYAFPLTDEETGKKKFVEIYYKANGTLTPSEMGKRFTKEMMDAIPKIFEEIRKEREEKEKQYSITKTGNISDNITERCY